MYGLIVIGVLIALGFYKLAIAARNEKESRIYLILMVITVVACIIGEILFIWIKR